MRVINRFKLWLYFNWQADQLCILSFFQVVGHFWGFFNFEEWEEKRLVGQRLASPLAKNPSDLVMFEHQGRLGSDNWLSKVRILETNPILAIGLNLDCGTIILSSFGSNAISLFQELLFMVTGAVLFVAAGSLTIQYEKYSFMSN